MFSTSKGGEKVLPSAGSWSKADCPPAEGQSLHEEGGGIRGRPAGAHSPQL